ncbi:MULTISPECIES: hypothetical protein [unclassified Streptomyces]|uniref:hypothetical protein n=1 Tax=unclassified Streptomyces TaxID=2593676 RepID=UPI001F1EEC5E|nr:MULTISPECIES: hypothetical protein [unclassified Streptomyces]MCF0086703.1 hypothetical protein [Streptomyces sp. MH192]MCF0098857.1 hypothetical protein [Streptomyces sp. MH191]
MDTIQAPTKRRSSPLLYPAVFLSLASLAWTTWSLVDLLGTGLIGVTVAAGADIVWGSVIIAEARGLRIAGRTWIVPAVGWITLLIVAGFLALHGIEKDSLAMAAAGPFLPLGAKAVWALALADMRDPAALTHDDLHELAEMERRMTLEEQQHRIEMRRRTMHAELVMRDVSTDFDIELMRQDRARELNRMRPMDVTPVPELPHRSDAVGETPDETRDAPQQRAALAPAEAPRPTTDTPRIIPDAVPQQTDEALRLEGLSKAAAVRIVRDAEPTASAPQIVKRLAHHGIDADAAYVRTVLSRINRQRNATDGGYL